jgi:spore germination cell wall hydrolase CwlJ-like protein
MAHFYSTLPTYSCTCSRFTGIVEYDEYNPVGTGVANPNARIPRTNYCKHILARMKQNGDPRYDAVMLKHLPLNHPHGNIQPVEDSTYSQSYGSEKGKPSRYLKSKLWGDPLTLKKQQKPPVV